MKPDSNSGSNLFAAMSGTDVLTYTRDAPGMSVFALSDGVVITYTRHIPEV